MSQATEKLVTELSAGLAAVRPLRPPVVRALLWLALAAVLLAAMLWLMPPDLALLARRTADPRFALELAATLITGIVATVAAFHLSIPGREQRWALAPLPPLALWLASSGLGCLRNGLGTIDIECLYFVLTASLPLSLLLLVALRRARPIAPLPVALIGGLGVAALAAFVLQFFHPFDVTVMDLIIHALAVAAVVGAVGAFGGRWLGRAQPVSATLA